MKNFNGKCDKNLNYNVKIVPRNARIFHEIIKLDKFFNTPIISHLKIVMKSARFKKISIKL
jgi:hypothetical protein